MSNSLVVELGINDKEKIEHLLHIEPSFNGFVISDLEHVKYGLDFVRLYGEMEGHNLQSVLMIFNDKIVYYSPDDRRIDCYVQYVRESNVPKLVGKKTLVEKFLPYLEIKGQSDCYVLEMNTAPYDFRDDDLDIKRMSTREEAAKLHDLFMQVREYGFTGLDRETYIDEQIKIVQNDSIRTYFTEVNGEMVSTAAYVNDRTRTAIVVGVATPPQYRKRGYASKVIYRLCLDAISAGKVLYLFYTNPQAGSVYRNLGFHEGGEWKVLNLS
jgi:predicted GNAT family acetyltransferase